MRTIVGHLKKYGYYVELTDENGMLINGDSEIAKKCGLDVKEYRRKMKAEFNANDNNNMKEVFFKDRNDAKAALEWIIGASVMNALLGGGNEKSF